MRPDLRRRLQGGAGRTLSTAALAAAGLVATTGVAAAQGGMGSTPAADSFRSIVHILGILIAGVLASYALRARRQFQGGVFAESATYTIVGAVMFVVAFALVELEHGFGVTLLSSLDVQARLAIRMGLFTTTVFVFGWAVYKIADTLQEWELT